MEKSSKRHWGFLFSLLKTISLIAGLTMIVSCKNDELIDAFKPISKQSWTYAEMPAFKVKVNDKKTAYQLRLNLRLTADYGYSNLYVLVHQTGPDHKVHSKRVGLTVADKDGRWLGKGIGSLYSYQVIYDRHYQFPDTGEYKFRIEQNMRDNPLAGVSDVGIAIIPDEQ